MSFKLTKYSKVVARALAGKDKYSHEAKTLARLICQFSGEDHGFQVGDDFLTIDFMPPRYHTNLYTTFLPYRVSIWSPETSIGLAYPCWYTFYRQEIRQWKVIKITPCFVTCLAKRSTYIFTKMGYRSKRWIFNRDAESVVQRFKVNMKKFLSVHKMLESWETGEEVPINTIIIYRGGKLILKPVTPKEYQIHLKAHSELGRLHNSCNLAGRAL